MKGLREQEKLASKEVGQNILSRKLVGRIMETASRVHLGAGESFQM